MQEATGHGMVGLHQISLNLIRFGPVAIQLRALLPTVQCSIVNIMEYIQLLVLAAETTFIRYVRPDKSQLILHYKIKYSCAVPFASGSYIL